ncbi:insulinase family protein [Rhodococcus sp. D2-41]|uniref:Insulinase family protein n=1 Tax=Speluncibacter jeojiensis TaxID=2710754 RepID=A0A9X4LVL9_9ACTN|nr:pitrilysin family protein [Rhodococcus sp. D2-41]MDG3008727.1 insulinase family protein [Rhodococcus sp. D2-41]MDG3013065.1 insulinase family protein [Corynebacteriales bacterium D3-21]
MAFAPRYRRLTLGNGLRVLIAPDRNTPAVAVAVHYDVGFRSEPEGRTGFAHLFEHLMFQGSASLPKLEHARVVQSSGGSFNGSTRPDYTDYYEVLPAAALERALFLEADRMRAPRITAENLANQVEVVKEEIRLNVVGRPYGGLPWILVPPLLFDTFANAHNGYGDFAHLDDATVADCEDFFATFYAPANAVLTIAGNADPDRVEELVHRHFGDIEPRPAPPRRSFAEPGLRAERRGTHHDPYAELPAVAVGYRMPDAATDLTGYVAHVVLAAVLADGDSARLQRGPVQRDGIVTDITVGPGLFGTPLDSRDPEPLLLTAVHPDTVGTDRVLAAIDAELDELAAAGPKERELAGVVARWRADTLRHSDRLTARTLELGSAELLFGVPEMTWQLADLVAAVDPEQVAQAAAAVRGQSRAVLEVTVEQECS